ncbi:hypothetical protein [Mesorhizobium carmichaelinearum]|uniref:hypothetical protein n=1 Tax=Mesorhizobium carmichaelinearum TaxID=1208188 RepID=UPI00117BF9DE|nr:hypothetical protein [Mesorhizobium carmichaelinearum]
MSPEPLDIWPIDLDALTPKQREALYADAVRRARQERSEAIWLSIAWIASIFRKRAPDREAAKRVCGLPAKKSISRRTVER